MKSILLISHGPLAKGMMETAKFFFGENIEQLDYLSLEKSDSAEYYRERLLKKVEEMDKGDGVIVFCDLLGGTPSNQTIYINNEKVVVITGMNLSMVMECIGMRLSDNIDIEQILEAGKTGINNLTKIIEEKKKNKIERRKVNR